MYKKIRLLIVGFIFFAPFVASAATFIPTCSEWTVANGATCTSDVIELFGGIDEAQTDVFTSNGVTYYITLTKSSGDLFVAISNGITSDTDTIGGSGNVQFTLTGQTSGYFYVAGNTFTGTVADTCISDISFDECILQPEPTEVALMDNPNQNLFNGMLLFFIAFLIPLWFFKKPIT